MCVYIYSVVVYMYVALLMSIRYCYHCISSLHQRHVLHLLCVPAGEGEGGGGRRAGGARRRSEGMHTCVYIYIYMCIRIHIYIYIYVYT